MSVDICLSPHASLCLYASLSLSISLYVTAILSLRLSCLWASLYVSYTYTHKTTNTHTQTHTHTRTPTHKHTYTHTHTRARAHTHTHLHIRNKLGMLTLSLKPGHIIRTHIHVIPPGPDKLAPRFRTQQTRRRCVARPCNALLNSQCPSIFTI